MTPHWSPQIAAGRSAESPTAKQGWIVGTRLWNRGAFRAAVLLLFTLLLYQPSFRAGFIWDDDAMVTANPLIKSGWSGLRDIWFTTKFVDYIPVTLSSFWLEWRLWGMQATGYHAMNVLLHALNVVLLWRVLLRLRVPGGWLAALVFAAHPVCVASVTWVAERKNTLSMLFYMLSLLWYLRFDQATTPHSALSTRQLGKRPLSPSPSVFYLLSLAAFLLALWSKPSVVVLPVILLLCAWWLRGAISRRDLVRAFPFLLLALVVGLLTGSLVHQPRLGATIELSRESLLVRCLGATRAIWFYLGKDLLPLNLTMHYPRWDTDPRSLTAYVPGLLLAGLFGAIWRYRRSWGRACLFGLGYFVLALSPALGVVNMAYYTLSQVADHFQYLALPGFIALLMGGGYYLWETKLRTLQPSSVLLHSSGFVLLLLVLLGLLSWRHQRRVGNPEALWRDNIAKNPNSWPARNNLGQILADQKHFKEAEEQCLAALAIKPDSADSHYNLGNALFRQNRIDEAIGAFSEAVRLGPGHSKAHNNLASSLILRGRLDEALSHLQEATRLDPENFEAHVNLANVLSQRNQSRRAIEEYLVALRLQPSDAEAHNNLGGLLATEGKVDEALTHFSEAIRLKPDFPEAQANLGNALSLIGNLEQALRHCAEAARLQPENAAFQNGLGDVLAKSGRAGEAAAHYVLAHSLLAAEFSRQGKTAEAIDHWRKALSLDPGSPRILNNLAWLIATSADARLRNAAEAVRLAEQACALSGSKSPSFLDTLAAAYAEAGRFDDAIRTARRAVEAAEEAGEKQRAAQLHQRLLLYQSRQPYREP
jgi:protein O-mannosyl-transferase